MATTPSVTILALVSLSLCQAVALGQDSAELMARMKAMEERIKALELEVQTLKGQQTVAVAQPPSVPPQAVPEQPAPEATVPAPRAAPALGGAGGAAAKVLNPDIAVIGDFLGAAGNGAGHATPALEMHESEVGFQAILDPYARADFFVSFGEQGVDLEEGYITFPALRGGMQLRVGKMRAAFGRVNLLHNHALPWTDRPLVTQNLIAGEEGLNDAGLAVSRIFAGPKDLVLEGTAQVFRGDSENLFRSYRRSDVSTVGHLRAYRDITESTNVDLGVSYSRGHSVFGPNIVNQLYGIDATFRYKPLRRAIYTSFLGRSEFIWSRFEGLRQRNVPFGFYVSGDYQLARRWFVGLRFDRSDRPQDIFDRNILSILRDTGGSAVLTYWPSEFSQIRGQLRRTRYGEHVTANEFLFQFQFSIGAHGAHPF